jgi:hypothetical protein
MDERYRIVLPTFCREPLKRASAAWDRGGAPALTPSARPGAVSSITTRQETPSIFATYAHACAALPAHGDQPAAAVRRRGEGQRQEPS